MSLIRDVCKYTSSLCCISSLVVLTKPLLLFNNTISYLWFLSVFHVFTQYGALKSNSFRVGGSTLALAFFWTWAGLWLSSKTKRAINHMKKAAWGCVWRSLRNTMRRIHVPSSQQEQDTASDEEEVSFVFACHCYLCFVPNGSHVRKIILTVCFKKSRSREERSSSVSSVVLEERSDRSARLPSSVRCWCWRGHSTRTW